MNFIEAFRGMKEKGFRPPAVTIKNAGHKGLGVFAATGFKAGDPIEFCHAFILEWQAKYQRDSMISKYCFAVPCHCQPAPNKPPCLLDCPKNGHRTMMPMGYGSCYNSSDIQGEANAQWMMFVEESLLVVAAIKDIQDGDEILTWFGQGYYDSWCKKKP